MSKFEVILIVATVILAILSLPAWAVIALIAVAYLIGKYLNNSNESQD